MEDRVTNGLRIALAVLLTSTVGHAQKVDVDSDPSAPFPTYRTYAWAEGTPTRDPLSEEKLHIAVDARLAGKGLALITIAPDLIVATHATMTDRKEPGDRILVVEVHDAQTKKTVWRGVATASASDKPTRNDAKMNRALDKMFERFPIAAVPGATPR